MDEDKRLNTATVLANQQAKLNAKNINIVTCGTCGDFPDLFH